MHFNRAHYITLCQQFLVTGVVGLVGLSAAGVMTLQIVEPGAAAPNASDLRPAVSVSDAYTDTTVVTPTVKEVKVEGIAAAPDSAPDSAPGSSAETADGPAPDAAAARRAAPAPSAASEKTTPQKTTPQKTTPQKTTPQKTTPGKTGAEPQLAAQSEPQPVHGFATVGVTWDNAARIADDEISVQIRTEKDGEWSDWTQADYHDEHGPDADSEEASRVRPGTEAVVVGDVDQVQMRVETPDGEAPDDLQLALIDPGQGALKKEAPAIDTARLAAPEDGADPDAATPDAAAEPDAPAAAAGEGQVASLAAMKIAPKPQIFSRAQWGANENLREKGSLKYGTIKAGFIHHTVNANDYTEAQVPALLRGIYAYHTQSRGWADIGYNFLVDRFGRIWEGRYGGVDKAVIGAHTLGYNDVAFAMSAIGNFDIASPPQAVLDAFARLFAWKLSIYNISAVATGIDLKGKKFAAISGHRDAGSTACPGKYLYAQRVAIRNAAAAIQNGATPAPAVDPATLAPLAAPAGVPAPTASPGAAPKLPTVTLPARVSLAGDGWPDLVTVNAAGDIRITPTGGMLGYTAPRLAGKRFPAAPQVVVSSKLHGNAKGAGAASLLARNKRGVTMVFAMNADGTAKKGAIARTRAFAKANLLLGAGDLDGDGRNDVISRERGTQRLLLHRGLGRGRFAPPKLLHRSFDYRSIAAGVDQNRDGVPDLIALDKSGVLWLVPGVRGGRLAPRVWLANLGAGARIVNSVGDVTGDGLKDVAVTWAGGLTTIHSGTTTTGFGPTYGPFAELAGLSKLSAVQVTSSRGREIVGLDHAKRVVVVGHNGRVNLQGQLAGNLRVAGVTQVLSVGDWDRDGYSDVITRQADGDELVLRTGLGNGRFGQARSLGKGWKTITRLAAVGDVTGDGFPDLIGQTAVGQPVRLFRGAGNNGFLAPVLAPKPMRVYNQVGTAGWSDPAAILEAGATMVPVAGTTPTSALAMANRGATVSYDTYVAVGDVNGDGVADVIAREGRTGVLWLLPGKTSGGFGPRMWVAAGFADYRLIG